ncbi:MAG: lysophospholipid acyltransferase family protein [Candidatus Auribacterota bacterium]
MLRKFPRLRRRLKTIKRAVQYTALYYIIIGLKRFFLLFPHIVAYRFCETVGRGVYYCAITERRRTLTHLKQAFGDTKTDAEIKKIAKNCFLNLSRNVAEMLCWEKWTPERMKEYIVFEGFEHFREAKQQGKGAVVVTGHCGNWEYLGGFSVVHGIDGAGLARKFHDERINKLLFTVRQGKGFEMIDRDESPRKMLNVMRNNNFLGILADQDIRKINGTFVNFFGKQAFTPTAPVTLALIADCPLIPSFSHRNPDNPYKHTVVIYPPIDLIRDRKNPDAIQENTQRWTTVLENHIRKYPDQWVWMHRRWRTTPETLKGEKQ